ncbi:putative heat shock factor like protein [Astathelohania contejeani]|uniref:Heat shock factor like protein n=1 Tax=Astathelohania contejeani TaxID=164912 RepID=A0ABQ7HYN3_9MICR|nr:putative heat shock factor like protein [Thelohania contejeani]
MNLNEISYKIPKFITKLYKAVIDKGINTITWNNDGKTIIIHNKDDFIKKTIGMVSNSKDYSSFIRQLNNYGFVKLKGIKEDEEEYYHKFFTRENPELLQFITRKRDKNSSLQDIPNIKNDIAALGEGMEVLNTNTYVLNNEIAQLKKRLDEQDKTINGLIEVLSRVFRLGIQNDNIQPALGSSQEGKKIEEILNECGNKQRSALGHATQQAQFNMPSLERHHAKDKGDNHSFIDEEDFENLF